MSVTRPSDPEPFIFSIVVSAYEWVPRPIRTAISTFFFTVSPDVPVDITEHFKNSVRFRVLAYPFVAAFFCCLVVTATLCWFEGTFYGSDVGRLYFVQDRWNLALYAFVCPFYVSGSVFIIVTTFQHWSRLNQFALNLSGERPAQTAGSRFGIALFVILLICALAISSYMYDSLNSEFVTPLYWFMEDGGRLRALNRVGYYYVALNFVLLFITALAVFCFFSVSMEAMWAGKSLAAGGVQRFRVLRDKLEAFTHVYLATKFIAAVYMVNTIIWKDSPLGGNGATFNILIAGSLLTLIGVFFIAVPRLYVELKWYEFKVNLAAAGESDESFDDLRTRGVRLSSHLLDLLIIGAFVGAFWGIDIDPLSWLRSR